MCLWKEVVCTLITGTFVTIGCIIEDNILVDSKPLNYFALEKECISLGFLGKIGNVEITLLTNFVVT